MRLLPLRWSAGFICALAGVMVAGCFRSPDMARLSCTSDAHCPAGNQCVRQADAPTGICQRAVDAGGTDAIRTIDSATGGDSSVGIDLAPPVDLGTAPTDAPLAPEASPSVDVAIGVEASVDLLPSLDTNVGLTPDISNLTDQVTDGAGSHSDQASDPTPDVATDSPPDLGPDLPPLKPLGAGCTQASECANNFCTGGVCCNRACTGACEECTTAAGGQCTYKSGSVCNQASDCLDAAVCSGTSSTCPARSPKKAGVTCGNVTCAGSTQSASACDGAGNCGARGNTDCWPYACTPGTGCKTNCTTSTDCVSESAVFCGSTGQCKTDNECWRDLTTNLLWQVNPDSNYHQLADAKTTCASLSICGFDDWNLPSIDQLRSLIRGCPNGVTGGACGVTNSCLGDSCDASCVACENMLGPSSGCYEDAALNGPCGGYWSSSTYTSNFYGSPSTRVREVDFAYGTPKACDPTDGNYARCVR